jgi:hypothetical protein
MSDSSIKTELLAELDQEWAHVERICAGLSEKEMLTPDVEGEWSIKDILCHLSAWEKYLLDRLGYVLSGQTPHYPSMQTWEDVHQFNARIYAENRDRPLNSAKIEFRSLYHGVMTVVAALSEEQLNQSYSYDFTADKLTLARLIRGNTCNHFREHCNALEKEVKP